MVNLSAKRGLILVGAGPAGLAPLFAAAGAGRLQDLLRLGVTILEQGEKAGCGNLGLQAIHSDSSAEAFLDIVIRSREPKLKALCTHPATQALVRLGKEAAPLALVSEFLELVGKTMCDIVTASPGGEVLTGTQAIRVTQTSSDEWRVRCRTLATGTEHEIEARFVVLATGAYQPEERLRTEQVAGVSLAPRYQAKLVQSGEVLAHGGVARVQSRLRDIRKPKIVVVGGSTSAGSVAACLLRGMSSLGNQSVTILHRQPLRIFYESAAEAAAERYTEFSPQDICLLTGRVNRFSGFRLESRELIMRARGLGNRPEEPRLKLLQLLPENTRETRSLLHTADLIVAAFGYRPRVLPIFDREMKEILTFLPHSARWSVVDRRCRLLTREETSLRNLFAIGLAIGPGPDPSLGGEADFRGQVNSLWMWQHVLGLRIVDEICSQTRFIPSTKVGDAETYCAEAAAAPRPLRTQSAFVGMEGGAQ